MERRHNTGAFGEEKACTLYTEMGFSLVSRNYRIRSGEIDIIASRDNLLVFIEVKTRTNPGIVDEAFLVNRNKQEKIKKTARHFLLCNPQFHGHECRFDIVCFVLEEGRIIHFENAFS